MKLLKFFFAALFALPALAIAVGKTPSSGPGSRINPHQSGDKNPALPPHFVPASKGVPTAPKQEPHYIKEHQDLDQVRPAVFRNARVKYTNVPTNKNGHGFDINVVNALESYRVHTNVRLSTQKLYLLELNRTSAVLGNTYWIQTSENNTNPTFEWWLSKSFTYREFDPETDATKEEISILQHAE